jgi:hypothetical protein
MMRPLCWLALVAVLGTLAVAPRVVAAANPADRSAPDSLAPGARIRLWSPVLGDEPIVGSFTGFRADTLAFKPARSKDPIRVLLDERAAIEMSTATHNRAGRYAAIGAALGAIIGGVIGDRSQTNENVRAAVSGEPKSASEAGAGPLLLGLALGAAVGGIVGANRKVDTWVPVRLSHPSIP